MSQLHKWTLLYVEDDEDLRKQFMRILKPRFKKVYEAIDGLQALEIYDCHHPDMLLLDINLPKIDGLNAVQKIRENDPDTPIIILSAYSDQEKLLKAIKLGLSEYLIKPVPYKKLLLLLEETAMTHDKTREKKNTVALTNSYLWKKNEKSLFYNNEMISLTKREMILLDLLIEQRDRIVDPYTIENLMYQNNKNPDSNVSLSNLLKRLRKKLPLELIENIYGEGYRIKSNH